MVYFLMPETMQLSLEELDQVFSVPTMKHARYQAKSAPHFFKKYVLRQRIADREPLYEVDPSMTKTAMPMGGAA